MNITGDMNIFVDCLYIQYYVAKLNVLTSLTTDFSEIHMSNNESWRYGIKSQFRSECQLGQHQTS